MNDIGKRLKALRLANGYTQSDLALVLDTTSAAISRYEQGKRKLRFDDARAIAGFLGVPVSELYGIQDDRLAWLEEHRRRLEDAADRALDGPDADPGTAAAELRAFLRAEADGIEALLRNEAALAADGDLADARDAAPVPAAPPRPDLADLSRRRRTDELDAMFSACPARVQGQVLAVVRTFLRLNGPGRKQAMGRVRDLSELPRYRAQGQN